MLNKVKRVEISVTDHCSEWSLLLIGQMVGKISGADNMSHSVASASVQSIQFAIDLFISLSRRALLFVNNLHLYLHLFEQKYV